MPMATQAMAPRRIADYFFMVGLRDDYLLTPTPSPLHEYEPQVEESNGAQHKQPCMNGQTSLNLQSPVHSSLFDGDTTVNLTSSLTPPVTPIAAPLPGMSSGGPIFMSSADRAPASQKRRSRSKSMAQSNQERPNISALPQQQNAPLSRKQSRQLTHTLTIPRTLFRFDYSL